MSEDGRMNIVEFLNARIAEDEKTATALLNDLEDQISEEYAGEVDEKGKMTPARLLYAQMWAHYDGQSKRRSFAKGQKIAALASPQRVLAECAAKRVMLSGWQGMVVEHRRAFKVDPPLSPVIAAFAAVYKDHPDYSPDWQ